MRVRASIFCVVRTSDEPLAGKMPALHLLLERLEEGVVCTAELTFLYFLEYCQQALTLLIVAFTNLLPSMPFEVPLAISYLF